MEEKHLGSKGRLRPCGVVFVSAPCGVWVPIRAAPRGFYPTGDMGDAMGWLKGDREHLCPVCWGGRLGEMGRSTEEAAQGTVSTGHSEGGWGIRGTPNPRGLVALQALGVILMGATTSWPMSPILNLAGTGLGPSPVGSDVPVCIGTEQAETSPRQESCSKRVGGKIQHSSACSPRAVCPDKLPAVRRKPPRAHAHPPAAMQMCRAQHCSLQMCRAQHPPLCPLPAPAPAGWAPWGAGTQRSPGVLGAPRCPAAR